MEAIVEQIPQQGQGELAVTPEEIGLIQENAEQKAA